MSWQRIPKDSARRYVNTETGETISRRQYDQQRGRLAGTGLTFEKQAKESKPGGFLAGLRKSRIKDTNYFMSAAGISDSTRAGLIRFSAGRGKHSVRFIYEKNGKHQSSNWHRLGGPNTDAAIQASLVDLIYPDADGNPETYDADTLIGFAFV